MFERFTERARQVVVLAQEEARTLKHNYIGTEHILLGLLREEEGLAARVLESLDITVERVRAQVVRIVGSGEEVTSGQIPFTPRAKKVLELALREALSLGHNYIGTEHILLGLVRENEGVAARILLDFDADSEKIRNEVIRMLSGPGGRQGRAAAGAGAQGEGKKSSKLLDQFGRNLTKLAAEAKLDPVVGRETEIERIMQILSRRTKNNPVLIGEPGVGKPAVARGELQTIGATTLDEYRKYLERDSALERRFQQIRVDQPSTEETVQILKGLRDRYEQHHRVGISDEALEAAAELADRYISDRFLPDKAIDLIDEAASRARIKSMTAPPVYRDLEEEIEQTRRDKEAAIEAQEFEKAANLRDQERQLTNKKRELEEQWRSGESGERPEIGEEEIADIVSMWTGIPVGQLTEAVRRKPYSVLLLDEIEKAHPDVFNILLQILEDGRLTDAQGRTVDFRHTIVIMTSNIGAKEIAKNTPLGFSVSDDETGVSYDEMKSRIMGELKKVFRPEFLNRIDDVIVFHKLTREEIKQIIELLLRRIRESMAERELQLELSESAEEFLVDKGWDPAMGARPLRRAIQRFVEDPLADEVLRTKMEPG